MEKTPQEIEREALDKLRDGIEDFHLILKSIAHLMENEPVKFKLAIKMLK